MSLRKKINQVLLSPNVENTVKYIQSFVKPGDKILDLGSGSGIFTKIFREKGYHVTPVDVKNRSKFSNIHISLYDGKHLPFKNNQFDICFLLAVLHHTPNPEVVLKEAIRVSNKLVVYEDAVTNIFQRYFTYLVDGYFNRELIAPHTNKTDAQWRVLFRKLGLKLIKTKYEKTWLFLENPIYFLEK